MNIISLYFLQIKYYKKTVYIFYKSNIIKNALYRLNMENCFLSLFDMPICVIVSVISAISYREAQPVVQECKADTCWQSA